MDFGIYFFFSFFIIFPTCRPATRLIARNMTFEATGPRTFEADLCRGSSWVFSATFLRLDSFCMESSELGVALEAELGIELGAEAPVEAFSRGRGVGFMKDLRIFRHDFCRYFPLPRGEFRKTRIIETGIAYFRSMVFHEMATATSGSQPTSVQRGNF